MLHLTARGTVLDRLDTSTVCLQDALGSVDLEVPSDWQRNPGDTTLKDGCRESVGSEDEESEERLREHLERH